MRRKLSLGEWFAEQLLVAVVAVIVLGVLSIPVFVGIWLYFALSLPPVAAWIGVALYAGFVILLLMHVSWISTFWPEPWRNAFNKVIDCLGRANWPI